MNKGIIKSDIEKINDKLKNEIRSESVSISSIKEEFSNLNSYVKESHEKDLISIQNDLLKVSNHFKKNHDNTVVILEKNIEKYENVILANKKVFRDHL